MTKNLEILKKVLDDIAARSREAYAAPDQNEEEKGLMTRMYISKADAVFEVGIAMLRYEEMKELRHYKNNVIDLY